MAETTRLYQEIIPIRTFATKRVWERYAAWLRRHARVSLGLLPEPPRIPLNAKRFDPWSDGKVICEKLAFESLPGFFVTGNLYRPARQRKPVPGILSPHGHWPTGRLQDFSPLGSGVMRAYNLARQGAVVFAYDMVGYNDACQLPHRLDADPAWGLSLMALQTWNSVRALDLLQSLPEVDGTRLACTGESGGGTQTFALAAVDERLTVAAPIVMVSASFHGGCQCENAPLLRIAANNVELARLFAPKPQFLGSCTGDWTQHTPERELPALRDIYAFYHAQGRVGGLHVDMEHNYSQPMREAVYAFFRRHLHGALTDQPVPELDVARPPLTQQLVWWGREAPALITPEAIRALWVGARRQALVPILRDAESARAQAAPLLAHTVVLTEEAWEEFGSRDPRHISVRLRGKILTVAARRAEPSPDAADRDYLTYRRAPHAEAVLEILAALRATGATVLRGDGKAGPWALLAAALDPRVKSVQADLTGFDPEDDAAWTARLNIPALRQVGGLPVIFAAIGARALTLKGAGDRVQALAAQYAR